MVVDILGGRRAILFGPTMNTGTLMDGRVGENSSPLSYSVYI